MQRSDFDDGEPGQRTDKDRVSIGSWRGQVVFLVVTLLAGTVTIAILSPNQGVWGNGAPSPTAAIVAPSGSVPATVQPTSLPVTVRPTRTPVAVVSTAGPAPAVTTITATSPSVLSNQSRGYLTTPQELALIRQKADQGIEPYQSAVTQILDWAKKDWNFSLETNVTCKDSDEPAWNDEKGGAPILYAKALAYHLTGDSQYAGQVTNILQRIMTEVETISLEDRQCQLNFGWGTPELVAAADLIEDYWKTQICTGPLSDQYANTAFGSGNCKVLFQNWLAKNPYYVVSYAAAAFLTNWGAAATNTTAYIADYLWDRDDVLLTHRNPFQIGNGQEFNLTPAQAYVYANRLALNRMNGYSVDYGSKSCDYLTDKQQSDQWEPVKSQISETGVIPEEARREEYCNVPRYDGEYQNYPQIHLGNNIQQCELMLRRGDRSCFDNIDNTDIPYHTYLDPRGMAGVTHLYPGRGSIERGIKAIIVDSNTEWGHDSALEVAYRYYYSYRTLRGFEQWFEELDGRPHGCAQDICFGTLSHGFAPGESPGLPPVVSPP